MAAMSYRIEASGAFFKSASVSVHYRGDTEISMHSFQGPIWDKKKSHSLLATQHVKPMFLFGFMSWRNLNICAKSTEKLFSISCVER
ncbi:hypothetical protein Bca101_063554 [Brassica carinata]